MSKKRVPLSPGYHAEAGATKGDLHEVYTTLGDLHGYERIYVGSLMKSAVDAWAATASSLNDEASPHERTNTADDGGVTMKTAAEMISACARGVGKGADDA